jgi:hypothetical protein
VRALMMHGFTQGHNPIFTPPRHAHKNTRPCQNSVEEQLPSAIALDLAAAYRKQMADPPALTMGMGMGGSFSAGAGAAGDDTMAAAASAAASAAYSPARRKSEGQDSALAQVVAQGTVAATQEQQRVAVSEEAWASKQSPAKRDDACAIM